MMSCWTHNHVHPRPVGQTFECVYILQNQLACTCTCSMYMCVHAYLWQLDQICLYTKIISSVGARPAFTLVLADIHEPFDPAWDQRAATPLLGKLQRDLLDIPSLQGQDVMSSTSTHATCNKNNLINQCWFSHWGQWEIARRTPLRGEGGREGGSEGEREREGRRVGDTDPPLKGNYWSSSQLQS